MSKYTAEELYTSMDEKQPEKMRSGSLEIVDSIGEKTSQKSGKGRPTGAVCGGKEASYEKYHEEHHSYCCSFPHEL